MREKESLLILGLSLLALWHLSFRELMTLGDGSQSLPIHQCGGVHYSKSQGVYWWHLSRSASPIKQGWPIRCPSQGTSDVTGVLLKAFVFKLAYKVIAFDLGF